MCLCVFRLPRAFLENDGINYRTNRAFLVGVTKFDDIRHEGVVFQPTSNVDKVIVAQCTTIQGSAWNQLANVPVRDCLMMIDDFPSFPSPPQQAFTSPPPPSQYYTPISPDTTEDNHLDGCSPERYFNFPRLSSPTYSPSVSPGIETFPPTPNYSPQENTATPGAPSRHPRTIPPFRFENRPIPSFQLENADDTDDVRDCGDGGGDDDVPRHYRLYA